MISDSLFLNAKQVAEYLDLNEKKVYAMANERLLPGTKVTGKWLFPKTLIDRWIIDSCHAGTLSDRLIISGSDDPLLHYVIKRLSLQMGSSGLISYSACDTRSGLTHLNHGYADVCCIHWGHVADRDLTHPALLKHYSNHKQWVLVHAANRDFGIMMRSEHHHLGQNVSQTLALQYRWVPRQAGSGSQQQLERFLAEQGSHMNQLNCQAPALSEHELAAAIASGQGDFGLGCQGAAGEYGLAFVPLGTESFDLVMPQGIFFRQQLQHLFKALQQPESQQRARLLGGYDLSDCGKILWSSNT